MSEQEMIKAVAIAIAAARNMSPNSTDEDFAKRFVLAYRAMQEIDREGAQEKQP
jgi:hypothetical protein